MKVKLITLKKAVYETVSVGPQGLGGFAVVYPWRKKSCDGPFLWCYMVMDAGKCVGVIAKWKDEWTFQSVCEPTSKAENVAAMRHQKAVIVKEPLLYWRKTRKACLAMAGFAA